MAKRKSAIIDALCARANAVADAHLRVSTQEIPKAFRKGLHCCETKIGEEEGAEDKAEETEEKKEEEADEKNGGTEGSEEEEAEKKTTDTAPDVTEDKPPVSFDGMGGGRSFLVKSIFMHKKA